MKNLEAHFKEIKKQYPKTMSKDQLYRVAHISKATALYLLQSGAIPCKDTGKKTRRYTIKVAGRKMAGKYARKSTRPVKDGTLGQQVLKKQ